MLDEGRLIFFASQPFFVTDSSTDPISPFAAEGEPLLFDDCYEHEVWNHAASERVGKHLTSYHIVSYRIV